VTAALPQIEKTTRSIQWPSKSVDASAGVWRDHDGSLDAGFAEPVRFRILGDPNGPPVVVAGGISADRNCDRWWRPIVGREGALDPARHRLISFDWMSAGTTPGCGVGTRDHARALGAVLDHLEIDHTARLVGASYGAMVALAFAAEYPDRAESVIAISGAHRSTPAATARRLVQREIIRLASEHGSADRGVALARALALTTYRPSQAFNNRFHDDDPAAVVAALASYLDYNGAAFAHECSAERYLALSASLDHHCVDVQSIGCPVELIGTPSDSLVPLDQLRQLAGMLGERCRLHVIDSPYGHDAFLKSPELINPLLARLLAAAGKTAGCNREVDHEIA